MPVKSTDDFLVRFWQQNVEFYRVSDMPVSEWWSFRCRAVVKKFQELTYFDQGEFSFDTTQKYCAVEREQHGCRKTIVCSGVKGSRSAPKTLHRG